MQTLSSGKHGADLTLLLPRLLLRYRGMFNRRQRTGMRKKMMLSPHNSRNSNRLIKTAGVALMLGLALAGCGKKNKLTPQMAAANIKTIGVNSYLWRASLDALSFMPMMQTDSSGGVIVTDWYTNPANAGERMKVSVTILDSDLRADALRVSASRQTAQNGLWVDAPVQAATVQRLADIILTKARDLRRTALGG